MRNWIKLVVLSVVLLTVCVPTVLAEDASMQYTVGASLGYSAKWNMLFVSAEFQPIDMFGISFDMVTNPLLFFLLDSVGDDNTSKSEYSHMLGRFIGVGTSQYLRFGPFAMFNRLMLTDYLFTLNLGARIDIDDSITIQLYYPYVVYDLYTVGNSNFEYDNWYMSTFKQRFNILIGGLFR